MGDPLSIMAGVVGLLGASVTTGTALKDFYDGAAMADAKVKGLMTDVESFTQVLKLMKDTLGKNKYNRLSRLLVTLAITGPTSPHPLGMARTP
jgi:hypothetical protein